MKISFSQLFEADPELWREAARAWRLMSARLDDHADDADARVGQLRTGWSGGTASRAALTKVERLPRRLSACRGPMLEVDQILSDHAESVRQVQATLHRVLVQTRGTAVHVTPQGQIRIAAEPRPDQETMMLARWVSAQIDDGLRVVAEVDKLTSRRLRLLAAAFAADLGGDEVQTPPPAPGGGPAAVAQWWSGLTDAQRRWLLEHDPATMGGLDGVPSAARDRANRLLLEWERERLSAQIDEAPGRARAQLQDRLASLDQLNTRLLDATPRGYLLGFDPDGDGRAIVAVGDPDSSANVATYVPGAGADLDNLHSELDRVDRLRARATELDPTAGTSTILWLGYDAPDGLSAIGTGAAKAGGADLLGFQDGLVATHDGPIGQQTVLGHSYGSLVVGVADRSADLAANDVVVLGSPGMTVDHASQLRPAEQVWASTAANDAVLFTPSKGEAVVSTALGPAALLSGSVIDAKLRINADLWHGVDPSSAQFGAQRFESSRGSDPLDAHASYFDHTNPAMQTMAEIVVGHR